VQRLGGARCLTPVRLGDQLEGLGHRARRVEVVGQGGAERLDARGDERVDADPVLADRGAARGNRLTAAFLGSTAAFIANAIVAETTTRFAIFEPPAGLAVDAIDTLPLTDEPATDEDVAVITGEGGEDAPTDEPDEPAE